MTVAKTAISMDADLLDDIKAAVARGAAPSVSAYLSDLARRELRRESVLQVFGEEFDGRERAVRGGAGRGPARALRVTVLDSGALVAVERRDARVRALLTAAALEGERLRVLSVVLAQVWRGGGPRQALLARWLRGAEVDVVDVDEDLGRQAGVLLGRAGGDDVVDAAVVALARQVREPVVTSDVDDLRALDPQVRLVRV